MNNVHSIHYSFKTFTCSFSLHMHLACWWSNHACLQNTIMAMTVSNLTSMLIGYKHLLLLSKRKKREGACAYNTSSSSCESSKWNKEAVNMQAQSIDSTANQGRQSKQVVLEHLHILHLSCYSRYVLYIYSPFSTSFGEFPRNIYRLLRYLSFSSLSECVLPL